MAKELNKSDLAKMLGISRPTLDKYLEKGFPKKIVASFKEETDIELEKLLIENEIRIIKYKLKKYETELSKLQNLEKGSEQYV